MKLGFLGCGNMGEAFLKSILEKKVFSHSEIFVCNKTKDRNRVLSRTYKVKTTEKINDLGGCDIVLLAVKPQNLKEISFVPHKGTIIISMLAGTPVKKLRPYFLNTKIVRIMPNLGQFAGSGMTGVFLDPATTFSLAEKKCICQIISSGGMTLQCKKESQLDAITAISGSGPAYFFYFAEALEEAAKKLGFSEKDATLLTRQTFIGAAKSLEVFPKFSFSEWCARVASKGGTTEKALAIFKKKRLDDVVMMAAKAAYERAKRMSNEK